MTWIIIIPQWILCLCELWSLLTKIVENHVCYEDRPWTSVNHRRYICVILIIFAIFMGHLLAFFTTHGIVNNLITSCFIMIGFTIVTVSLFTMISLLIQWRNSNYEKKLEKSNDFYALSLKFQLRENFRAFRLLRRVSLISGIAAICMCIDTYFIIVYEYDKNVSSLLGTLFDTMQACGFSVFVSCGVFLQKSWRTSFAMKIGLGEVHSTPAKSTIPPMSFAQTSDTYFIKLEHSWEKKRQLLEKAQIVALFANYSNISPGFSTYSYFTFLFIELLANIYSLSSKIFHTNFTSIMLCYYAQGYFFTFTRVVLSIFQNGFIAPGESTTFNYQIMLIFSEFRFYELFIGIFLFVSLTIERVWATIYIFDYEVNTRRYVSVLLISSSIIISHISAYFTTRGIPFVQDIVSSCFVVLGFAMIIISISILISLIIQLRNAKYEKRLEEMNDLYGLSMKFQLRENFRAFRLLRRTTVVSGITTMCLCVDMCFVIIYKEKENVSSLLGAAFDSMQAWWELFFWKLSIHSTMIHSAFAIFISLGVFSQPSWRASFAKKIGITQRISTTVDERVMPSDNAITSDTYFNELEHSFVALFANYCEISPGYSTHIYFSIQGIELLTNIYSIFVFSLSACHIFKSKIFHTNFISILLSFYVHTYLFTFTRIILCAFQNGVIAVGDSTSLSYKTLICFSVLRFYGIFIAIYLFVALTIERVWATIFIRDYEVNTRRYVSVILILFAVSIALVKGYFTPRGFSLVGSLTTSCFILIGFTMIVGFTSAVRRLDESNDNYALSIKFQLRENFRAFRLLRQIAITSIFFSTTMCIDMYFVIIIYNGNKNLSSILGAIFDALQGCSLAIVISLALFSQPSWRASFVKKIGLSQWSSCVPEASMSRPENCLVMSDTYFNELESIWNKIYDVSVYVTERFFATIFVDNYESLSGMNLVNVEDVNEALRFKFRGETPVLKISSVSLVGNTYFNDLQNSWEKCLAGEKKR
ncbi:sre-56 [Pristionchus pacificus]|uniref:Sre-56 n=1 Tax=Pristionchus pacificus TaxID=54126 RepID=A0A2A6CBU1_PRIPA|nr:sre-56 [Pristionchus pacificus]|eukprot:PDM75644.1 sre-56 [Pristionchus pacificus]